MQRASDILVVDDETPIVDLIVDVLQDEGYKVRSATSGTAAIAAIDDQLPALILVDMYMPQMTGVQLVEHLRQHQLAEIPVVLMTAAQSAQGLLTGYNVDYLAKPFDIEDLLRCVARHAGPPEPSTTASNSTHP